MRARIGVGDWLYLFARVDFLIEKVYFIGGFSGYVEIVGYLKFSLGLGKVLLFLFFEFVDEILDVFEILEGLPCAVLFRIVFPLDLVFYHTFLTHTLV